MKKRRSVRSLPKRRSTASRPAKRKVAARPAPLDAMIDASAKALALRIRPAWNLSIRANLNVTLQHAAKVTAFALPDEAEPAPIFRA